MSVQREIQSFYILVNQVRIMDIDFKKSWVDISTEGYL